MTRTISTTAGNLDVALDIEPTIDHQVDWRPLEGSADRPSLRRRLLTGDAVAVALAWALPALLPGSTLALALNDPSSPATIEAGAVLTGATLATLLVLAFHQLYLSRVCSMRTIEIARVARASLIVGALALIGTKLTGEVHITRIPVLTAIGVFLFVNIWRMTFAAWLKNARKSGRYFRPVLLVGADDDAHNIYRLLAAHPELGYRVAGIVGKPSDFAQHDFGEVPYLGDPNNLQQTLDVTQLKGAVVSGGALGRRALNKSIRLLLDNDVHIHLSTGINGIDHRRLRSQSLAYEPMVYVERVDLDAWQVAIKRTIDVTVSLFVLLLSSPVLLASALLVKVHDRGPIFFSQERVGRHGDTFRMLKFRSMVIDAEARLDELKSANVRQGPLFKVASDPRVTPIGRILRATSIDELPQLINVLRGDMSLVGPRPALPHEVEKFSPELRARHNVLPGITGLWQVEGRDNPDFSLYQRFDIFYVENWSVTLDVSILIGTAKVVAARGWRSLLAIGPRGRSTDRDLATVLD